NTAIFSLVDGLILRPLPVAEPTRLAILSGQRTSGVRPSYNIAAYDDIRRRAAGTAAFTGTLAYGICCAQSTVTIGKQRLLADRLFVSGDFFPTLGVSPWRGRLLAEADDVPGGGPDGPVIVISYRFWQSRFGGASGIAGSQVVLERVPVTIVGVTPPD